MPACPRHAREGPQPGYRKEGRFNDDCQTTTQAHEKGAARPCRRGDAGRRRAARQRRRIALPGGNAGALRHLRRGRHALRGRAQHHPGALRRLQRDALPGQALLRQHHAEHRRGQRGRGRQRGGAGLLLLRHHLRHHRDLRPVGPRQQPHRRAGRRRGGRARRPRERYRGPGHGRRREGLRRLHRRGRRLPRRQHLGHRDRRRGRGRVRDLRRHAPQQRLLLRLRQRRDQQRRQRLRPHGSHLLRDGNHLGPRLGQRPVDHGRHGERPVLRPERRPQLRRPDHQLPVHHRDDRGRVEPVGHPRRQRAVRLASRPTSAASAPRATTRCTRRARSSSASAATTARAPQAPSTRAS